MVICDRCHRSIPESELARHMLTHKTKHRKFSSLPVAKQDTNVPKIADKTSFEEFSHSHYASLGKRSNLTTDQVQAMFNQILQEMRLEIGSLKVDVKRATMQSAVIFDEQSNVELCYDDDYFRTLSEDEVRASLSHEACHIATLPHTLVIATDSSQSLQISFIELYDEFLAHKEFARRFTGSTTFNVYDQLKNKDFNNYATILELARIGQMDPVMALFIILNDAIYFPVIGDSCRCSYGWKTYIGICAIRHK